MTFTIENGSTVRPTLENQPSINFLIFTLVLSSVSLILNASLVFYLATNRPLKKLGKFTAMLSVAATISLTGASSAMIHRMKIHGFQLNMTALDCLLKVPSVWCYSFTEPIISSCSLIISIDYFLSLCVLNPKWKITERFANLFIEAVVALGLANITASYFTICQRSHVYVDPMCYHSQIMEKSHFRFSFIFLAVVSFCSLVIYVAAVTNLALRKSSFSAVRLVQVRRQAALRKHAVVAIVCSFMSQCLPHILSVILSFYSSALLHDCLFCLYLGFHSGLPAYIFWRRFAFLCHPEEVSHTAVRSCRQ